MKGLFVFITVSLIFLLAGNALAIFNSGSTGADGPFDLGAQPSPIVPSYVAINGTTATVTLPPDGILNLTYVNVLAGWTINFIKNVVNTPVYMLASQNVTIAGSINVNGGDAVSQTAIPGTGGAGGYDGGAGGASGLSGGTGLGPGGGGCGVTNCVNGGGGGFGTAGSSVGGNCGAGGSVYGNARILPLIGGSGGGGSSRTAYGSQGGGGGGGAILIASSGNIILTGSITANGGHGQGVWFDDAGGGSGGAVKLMANTLGGTGSISATGATQCCGQNGGQGRIRIETYTNNFASGTNPPYTLDIWSPTNPPGSAFPGNEPILRITQIAGANVPTYPAGSYAQPDVWLPSDTTNPVTVNLSASYIPVGTTVTVSVIPQYGSTSSVNATLSGVLEATTASASVNLSTQYSNVIVAQATYVMQEAMYWDDEKIEKVRVAATTGKEPETVYITESGKEIKSKVLKLAGLLK